MIIKNKRKRFFGFTLVELLVVLTLVTLITIFSYTNVQAQLQKARDAVRKSNIALMKNSIEEYYQDKDCYPVSIPECKNKFINGELVLIDDIPCDPKGKLSYTYVPETSQCPKYYQLYANLEYTPDEIIDKIGCRNGCGPDCKFNFGASSPNEKLNPLCFAKTIESTDVQTATTPSPAPQILQYVCSSSGKCEVYADPAISGCPNVYLNDSTCQDTCSGKANRCHDARGKIN